MNQQNCNYVLNKSIQTITWEPNSLNQPCFPEMSGFIFQIAGERGGIKKEIFSACEVYTKFKFQSPSVKYIWAQQPHPLICVL